MRRRERRGKREKGSEQNQREKWGGKEDLDSGC